MAHLTMTGPAGPAPNLGPAYCEEPIGKDRGMSISDEYFRHVDPMLDDHRRTLDPECRCDYYPIRNGLWQTIRIRQEVDQGCPLHSRSAGPGI